jgi:hypothetical protein
MGQKWQGNDGTDGNAWERMVLTGSRRRRWEVPVWIAVIAACMFLMGFLVGNAEAAGVPTRAPYVCMPSGAHSDMMLCWRGDRY